MYTIILDTETSGLTGKDRVIEFGIIVCDHNMNVVYKNSDYCFIPFKLSKSVSEYNGITNNNVETAKKIKETDTYLMFDKYNIPDNIVVIHNSWFDMYMLYLSHIQINCKVIDTLNCARCLYPESESYKLEHLLNKYVHHDDKKVVQKHRAIDDCYELLKLYKCMLREYDEESLIRFSMKRIVPFGKHKGKLWKNLDTNYLQWAHNKFLDPNSPDQLYVKTLLKLPMCEQQKKLATYLKLI